MKMHSKTLPIYFDFETLQEAVVTCIKCPRLVAFREKVPKRAAFKNENYWRKPVPGYGDLNAWLLIVGLAPAAHGGNRTGRLFTGDESARFLMNGLYQEGFTNQPHSVSALDGLQLKGCYMTAAVKCVPPNNQPTKEEFFNCSCYFESEFFLLKNIQAVLALGKLAFDAYLHFIKNNSPQKSYPSFSHGSMHHFEGWPSLFGCYHPSPQNTYTGKLTLEMLQEVLKKIKALKLK